MKPPVFELPNGHVLPLDVSAETPQPASGAVAMASGIPALVAHARYVLLECKDGLNKIDSEIEQLKRKAELIRVRRDTTLQIAKTVGIAI